jgi:ribosomal protein S18 acetylase RimI-like enzyme/uncharacterized membrane protein YphA (DoxX/SURF4 family)
MSDGAAQTVEMPASEQKPRGRMVTTVVRALLGLAFLVFGLNGFLNFIPTPKDMPQEVMQVMSALMHAGYMAVVSGAEVLIAILLLTNRFVPLALALLAPIVVGIITFHIAMGADDDRTWHRRSGDGRLPRMGISRGVPADATGDNKPKCQMKRRSEPFSIALATTDDCPDCAALLLDQLREHGVQQWIERLQEVLKKAVANPASGFILLARERERVIGVAYVAIILSVEHCGPVAWLEELYVDPDHRCRGIGTALLNGVIARLTATGAVAIDLEVHESHERTVSLYQRLGFRPLARSRWVRELAKGSAVGSDR